MKIGLIYDLEVAGRYFRNQTGIYRVVNELFTQLKNRKDISLFYSNYNFDENPNTINDLNVFLSHFNENIKAVNACRRRKFLPFRKEKLFRKIYNAFGVRNYKIINNQKMIESLNVFHSPFFPIHESLQTYSNLKKIVTIHDLIPILFPQYNSNTELLEKTIRSIGPDNYAICVSENTKKDLLNFAPDIDPAKVFVSLLAASPKFFYKCRDREKFSEVKKKYKITEKYFLSLSTLEPRKNIDHVIRSFVKMITERNIKDLSLVLVGDKGWDFDAIFNEYENAYELKDKIVITGRIPDEDLASVYSHANSFYYMSFYEGFGLPPLEAMQCGTATVVSDTSSLPEVVGEAGILLNPKDQDKLAEIMWRLYSDENYRNDLSEKALQRSKYFSWERSTAEHIEIYKKILQF